jgi:CheY-like chemotaxis protein
MHGGSVEVRSGGPGRGSEFVVRLPLLVTQPSASTSETWPQRGGCPRRRVRVVDDNEDAARLLSMAVEAMGSEVYTAFDGVEAIEIAARVEPDVVVMDIGMPRLDGYETARRMRDAPWRGRALLVALTGWGQEEDKQRAADAGVDRHLVKPLDVRSLRSLLEDGTISPPASASSRGTGGAPGPGT